MRGLTIALAVLVLLATATVNARARQAGAPLPDACGVICGDDAPAWSPDGRTIAFLHYVRGASGPRQTVASVPAAGGPLRPVVGLDSLYPKGNGPVGPFAGVSWSPDSATVAFVGWRGGAWTAPALGGRLTNVGTYLPAWSPDSRRIAIETPRDVGSYRSVVLIPAEIRVADPDGSSARILAGTDPAVPGGYWAASPAWSHNDEIAYVTGARNAFGFVDAPTEEIWSIRPDGSGARRLVPPRLHGSSKGYGLLGWSPDGSRLYFVVPGLTEVLAVDRAGGTPAYVYGSGADETGCCWPSPDGARLAVYRATPQKRFDLFVVELATGKQTRVLAGATRRSVGSLAWSPDSRHLAFTSGDECGPLFGVETVAVDGSHRTRLTSPCRRLGGSGPDVLRGGTGPDALYGRAGGDELDGRDGPDFLAGGPGDDLVHGSAGNDRLFGNGGRDRLYGDGGSDTIDHARVDRIDTVALDCEFVERR